MDGLLREVDIELACSSVLCAGSVLLLVLQIAERARSSRSHGQIKLPTTNEQAEELDTLLDEDVPEDVDSWRRHILYLKLACTAVAALNVVAWSVALYATGDTITKLQLYFWVS